MKPQVPRFGSYGENSHEGTHGHVHAGTHGHCHTGGSHGNTGGSHGHTGGSHGHTGGSHGHTNGSHGHTGGSHGHTGGSHGHTGGSHGHTGTHGHGHTATHGHTGYSHNGTGYGGKGGSGGVQVVKTRGEPIYVNSLPLPPEEDENAWTLAPRWCRGRRLFHCLTVSMLVALLLLALVSFIPHAFKWKNGQLVWALTFENEDIPRTEKQQRDSLDMDAAISSSNALAKETDIPGAHLEVLISTLDQAKNTAAALDCNNHHHGESFLSGGMKCKPDGQSVTVPLNGVYNVHARVTYKCLKNNELSATITNYADNYKVLRNISTVIAPKCSDDSDTTVAIIFGIFELDANSSLSLVLSNPASLRIGPQFTVMDLYRVSKEMRPRPSSQ